eukprot:jgi/Ulvmu1/3518/UM162_0025.1
MLHRLCATKAIIGLHSESAHRSTQPILTEARLVPNSVLADLQALHSIQAVKKLQHKLHWLCLGCEVEHMALSSAQPVASTSHGYIEDISDSTEKCLGDSSLDAADKSEEADVARACTPHKPGTPLPRLAPYKPAPAPKVHISAWARKKFRQPPKKPAAQRVLLPNHTFPAPKQRLERISEEAGRNRTTQLGVWNDLASSDHAQMRKQHLIHPSSGILHAYSVPAHNLELQKDNPAEVASAAPRQLLCELLCPSSPAAPVSGRADRPRATPPGNTTVTAPDMESHPELSPHQSGAGLDAESVTITFAPMPSDESGATVRKEQGTNHDRAERTKRLASARSAEHTKRVASSPGGLTNAAHPDAEALRATLLDCADLATERATQIEKQTSVKRSSGIAGKRMADAATSGDISGPLIRSFSGDAHAPAACSRAVPHIQVMPYSAQHCTPSCSRAVPVPALPADRAQAPLAAPRRGWLTWLRCACLGARMQHSTERSRAEHRQPRRRSRPRNAPGERSRPHCAPINRSKLERRCHPPCRHDDTLPSS